MADQPNSRRGREESETEFARIAAFSDGVFAIAITLLVLQIDVPQAADSGSELWHEIFVQNGNIYAFAISFAVIGRFWLIHHRLFGELTAFDARLMAINLLYLFWIVAIPLSSQVLGLYGGTTAGVVIYATNLAVLTLVGVLMNIYAVRTDLVADGRSEVLRGGRSGGIWACIVFTASIPVALIDPHIAPLLWILLFLNPEDRMPKRFRFFD